MRPRAPLIAVMLSVAAFGCQDDEPRQPPLDGGADAPDGAVVDDWASWDGRVRGVRFNPEVLVGQGVDPWFRRYDEADVRAQVRGELRSIRQVAKLSHITMVMSSGAHFTWPAPTADEMRHLAAFVEDVNAEGLRLALLVSHPCIIPNSIVNTDMGLQHVGGHRTGDVVNGTTLYWDVPRCEDTNVTDAEGYFSTILDALRARTRADGIAYLAHAGTPHLPYTAEMNVLHSGYRYLSAVLAYLGQVLPYLRERGDVPIGISTLPARWLTAPAARYAFLDNLRSAVPIEQLDVIDITSWVDHRAPGYGSIDPVEIISRVGAQNRVRVILSDFGLRDTDTPGDTAIARQIALVRDNGFTGYWIWQYKDDPQYAGLRQAGFLANDLSGWRLPLLAPVLADSESN